MMALLLAGLGVGLCVVLLGNYPLGLALWGSAMPSVLGMSWAVQRHTGGSAALVALIAVWHNPLTQLTLLAVSEWEGGQLVLSGLHRDWLQVSS